MINGEEFKPSADVEPFTQGRAWEEFRPGTSFRTLARTVTESDLIHFVTWAGFNESVFFAAPEGVTRGYSGRLVPAALTYSIAEGLVIQTNAYSGTGLAFLGMELAVRGPVLVGDTLLAVVTTIEARPTTKPGRGLVTSSVSVRNQRDERSTCVSAGSSDAWCRQFVGLDAHRSQGDP